MVDVKGGMHISQRLVKAPYWLMLCCRGIAGGPWLSFAAASTHGLEFKEKWGNWGKLLSRLVGVVAVRVTSHCHFVQHDMLRHVMLSQCVISKFL